MFNKAISLSLIVFTSLFLFSGQGQAQVDIGTEFKVGDKTIADRDFTPGTLLTLFLRNAYIFAGVILLFLIAGAGYTVVTGGGDPESMQKGRQTLPLALTGFVIIMTSYWIVQLISFITLGDTDFLLQGNIDGTGSTTTE